MHSITLCIESRLGNVELAAAAVRGLCAPISLAPQQIDQIELSVVESLNNIIFHAYNNQPGHKIELEWSIRSNSIHIAISNWGKPMERIPQGELPDVDAENGRGWYIIKSCVDRLEYSSEDGANIVKLIKYLDV